MPALAGRDLSIRPLGLGEVIDRSIAVTRRHFRPLFAAMLAVEAPARARAEATCPGSPLPGPTRASRLG